MRATYVIITLTFLIACSTPEGRLNDAEQFGQIVDQENHGQIGMEEIFLIYNNGELLVYGPSLNGNKLIASFDAIKVIRKIAICSERQAKKSQKEFSEIEKVGFDNIQAEAIEFKKPE